MDKNFPEGISIDWQYERSSYVHFFYPDFDKLILSILSWGWSVDFFSSGVKERNEEVIPLYLKEFLKHYTDNVEEDYNAIISSGRLRIFSRHHMTDRVSTPEGRTLTGYEKFGQCKKDLTIVSIDIENTILVDDDRSFVLGSQYPYIGMSYSSSQHFKDFVLPKKSKTLTEYDIEQLKFHPYNNANYVMGILLACREKLENNGLLSLRRALDLVIRHDGRSSIKESDSDYSPWFLHPDYELSNNHSKVESEFAPQIKEWIEKSKNYFNDLIEDAIPPYKKTRITEVELITAQDLRKAMGRAYKSLVESKNILEKISPEELKIAYEHYRNNEILQITIGEYNSFFSTFIEAANNHATPREYNHVYGDEPIYDSETFKRIITLLMEKFDPREIVQAYGDFKFYGYNQSPLMMNDFKDAMEAFWLAKEADQLTSLLEGGYAAAIYKILKYISGDELRTAYQTNENSFISFFKASHFSQHRSRLYDSENFQKIVIIFLKELGQEEVSNIYSKFINSFNTECSSASIEVRNDYKAACEAFEEASSEATEQQSSTSQRSISVIEDKSDNEQNNNRIIYSNDQKTNSFCKSIQDNNLAWIKELPEWLQKQILNSIVIKALIENFEQQSAIYDLSSIGENFAKLMTISNPKNQTDSNEYAQVHLSNLDLIDKDMIYKDSVDQGGISILPTGLHLELNELYLIENF